MHLHVGILAVMVVTGLACGFLNTVASSGSAVSLPILMLAGLHAVDANATNRIPVLIGGLAASAQLARSGVVRWKYVALAGVPVTAGAACGAVLAELIPSHDIRMLITGAIVMALVLILTKLKEMIRSAPLGEPRFGWKQVGWFLLVGLWIGFLVLDGATYMLLVLVLSMRLPLIQANAVKSALLVPTTAVAMLIFAARGSIDWPLGAAMGLGSVAGGVLGARLAVSQRAHRWIVGLLIFVVVAELIQMAVRYCFDLLG